MNTKLRTGESAEIMFHLRWVGKIALLVGATAAAGLVAMLYALTDGGGQSYGELIQSHSITQHRLGAALLIGGFFLLTFTAILTWLIALYSSFRIAGPLFRLSRNLEVSISRGPVKPVPIRNSDRLRREAALLEAGLGVLASHYGGMREDVDHVLKQIEAGALPPDDRSAVLARLKTKLKCARV